MPTEIKRERVPEFDLARAFAIICMIAVHTEYAVYNYGNEAFGTVFDYLGSPFAAPIFMFILGANIYLSSKNTPKQLFTRGVGIFISSLIFNVICHALPFFILDFRNGMPCYAENSLHWIFAVDILTFAGLAFIFFALMRRLGVGNRLLAVIALVCTVANMVLNSCFPIDFDTDTIPAILTSLFYNSSITGYFSFLGWIVFPIAGYIFIQIREKVVNRDRFYLILGAVSLLVYLVMVYGSFRWVPDAPLVVYEEEYSYYRMPLYDAVGNVAFCLAWISIIYYAAKVLPGFLSKPVARWNRNLTVMYYIQWFLINWCFVLASNNTFFVNEWQYVLCFVGVIAGADLIAVLYRRYQAWKRNSEPAPGARPVSGCAETAEAPNGKKQNDR